jgi:hypothetical protein
LVGRTGAGMCHQCERGHSSGDGSHFCPVCGR